MLLVQIGIAHLVASLSGLIVYSHERRLHRTRDTISRQHSLSSLRVVHRSFGQPSSSMAQSNNQVQDYWLPGFGLSRQIVIGHLQYFLGPSARVRPYRHQQRDGYLINGPPLTRVSSSSIGHAFPCLTCPRARLMISKGYRANSKGRRRFA